MLTFKEAFDRITTAYLNNELHPYDNCACFVGNLLNGDELWSCCRYNYGIAGKVCNVDEEEYQQDIHLIRGSGYTPSEIMYMENNFLTIIDENTYHSLKKDGYISVGDDHPDYENALFLAMDSTLEILKSIHQSKGENVDTSVSFSKRKMEVV